MLRICTLLCVIFTLYQPCESATPIVLWHGMGDSCCFSFSLGSFKKFLERNIPGVYVKSIMIGKCVAEDVENGYFMMVNKQVDFACDELANDPNLQEGFNAIGFSQGGQFLRALVQRCGHKLPPVNNLITLGGQHQGVYGIPNCGALKHKACDYMRSLLNHAAYYNWVQHLLVQASYWHDPLNEDLYKKHSIFLADINNENDINSTYVDNLARLNKFVMVKFENDSMVQPLESAWFGFYTPGQAKIVQSLQESDIYLQDRLGLQNLDNAEQLIFLSSPGDHLQFKEEWFIDNILNPYLN